MTNTYRWASAISGENSTIVDTTQTVNKINVLGVVAPVAGQTPDVSTITTDTEGVTISKATWIKESENKVLTSTDTFEAHQKYVLVLETLPKAYYVFAKEIGESNITVNEKYLKAEFIEERPELRLYYEAAEAVSSESWVIRQIGAGKTDVTIEWIGNENADGYLVQVKSGKKWKTVATITKNTTTSKKIKKLKAGKKYTYQVLAYKNVKKVVKKKTKTVKEPVGALGSVVAMTKTSAPKAVIKGSAHDYVKVSYKKKVGGAAYYVLSRSTEKKGTYTEIAQFTGTYTDTDVKTGTTYYYKVKACNANGFCSGNSNIVSKKPSLGKLSIKVKSPESQIVLITPTKTVSGEDGYVIEYSTKSKKGFKEIANLDVYTKEYLQESTEEKKLTGKKTYYYRARAYKVVDGKPVYGAWSKTQKVTVKK